MRFPRAEPGPSSGVGTGLATLHGESEGGRPRSTAAVFAQRCLGTSIAIPGPQLAQVCQTTKPKTCRARPLSARAVPRAGLVTLPAGLVRTTLGAVLLGSVDQGGFSAQAGCGSLYLDWLRLSQRTWATVAGGALVGVDGAAAVSGIVLLSIDARHRHRATRARSLSGRVVRAEPGWMRPGSAADAL